MIWFCINLLLHIIAAQNLENLPTCYYRDGTVASGHTPCTANTTSRCCPEAFDCYSSGICAYPSGITENGTALNAGYGTEVIEVSNFASCTDQNWSCGGPPDSCSPPLDTQCLANSVGYLPLQGCSAQVESLLSTSDWLRCNCADESCRGAQAKYEALGPLGHVICPAWREGQPFGTYCGTTLGNSAPTVTATLAQPTTVFHTVTVVGTSTPTPSVDVGTQVKSNSSGFNTRIIAVPVVSVCAFVFVVVFFLVRRRKAKAKTHEEEGHPPPYAEVVKGDALKKESFDSGKPTKEPLEKELSEKLGLEKDAIMHEKGESSKSSFSE